VIRTKYGLSCHENEYFNLLVDRYVNDMNYGISEAEDMAIAEIIRIRTNKIIDEEVEELNFD